MFEYSKWNNQTLDPLQSNYDNSNNNNSNTTTTTNVIRF